MDALPDDLPPVRGQDVGRLLEITRGLVALAARSVAVAAPTVTLLQYRALLVLGRSGPYSGARLAGQLGASASTASRLGDRLAALGYVTREVRRTDRRAVEIAVTPAGRRVVQAVERYRAAELRRLLGLLPGPARQHLSAALPDLQPAAAHLGPGGGE